MQTLGISLYPDKSTLQEDIVYLQKAKNLGYQRVFMSFLQIDIKNPMRSIQRMKESARIAHEMGFIVALDIHPMVFTYLKSGEEDLSYFHEMGIDILRLDKGYDGRMEAMMTHNPYGIRIEINMSNQTHELERILDQNPDRGCLCGSHNFYPQRYTGLSLSAFLESCDHFHRHHCPGAAFITSQHASISPWPVSEGLCTLECHRNLPIEVQAQHMKMLQAVDTILIGNAYASENELQSVKNVMEKKIDQLSIHLQEGCSALEKEIVFANVQEYRGDASEYVIRSGKGRMKYQKKSLPAYAIPQDIHRGDILILNEDYGQYKGELQIALCDRSRDHRINVVGKIVEEELLLMEALRPFQKFVFVEKRLEE